MTTYKVSEVIDILTIRKSRVQYYVDQEIIDPIVPSEGPGTYRKFSARNIAEIRLAMLLAKKGVGVKTIGAVIKVLKKLESTAVAELIKQGLPKGQYSFIDPTLDNIEDRLCYMALSYKTDDDPTPDFNVILFDSEKKVESNINIDTSMSVLMVNLTKIKDLVADKL